MAGDEHAGALRHMAADQMHDRGPLEATAATARLLGLELGRTDPDPDDRHARQPQTPHNHRP
ncbi:hypothetical protein ACFU8A_32070, partial [Streptomyces sp. NPDC057546]|uniref:hypothetical protein n=1 Tax=Streptomyces sp. NPDC057546 TaxID=3346165 RepID=UPI003699BCDD